MVMRQRYLHELLFLFRCNVLRILLWMFVSIPLVNSTYYMSEKAHKDLTSSSPSLRNLNARTAIHCALRCEFEAVCTSYSFSSLPTIASCVLYASIDLTFDVPEPGRLHFKKSANEAKMKKETAIKECKNTVRGETYKGKINTTISGLTCQRWDSNYPHPHGFGAILADEENYCRNPDGEPGPWCYTTSSRRFELCSIPLCDNIACTDAEFQCSFGKCVPKENQCDLEYDCPEGSDELGDCPIVECKILPQGYGYRGTMNKTTSGLDCQRWDSQSPHSHQYSSLGEEENYCRNPNNENLPWCYTTSSKRWESCDIPLCT